MRHVMLALAMSAVTPLVLASDFRDASWEDVANGTFSTVQKLYSNTKYYQRSDLKDYLAFRCDASPAGKRFFLTFGSDEEIASPNNSRITLEIRVDSGRVYEVKAQAFSDSYNSGSIYEFPQELIAEIKTGSKLFVNIYAYNAALKDQQVFHLAGSDTAVAQVQQACDITSKVAKKINVAIREDTKFDNTAQRDLSAEHKHQWYIFE